MTYRLYAPERTRPALKLPLCLLLFLLTVTAFAAPPKLATPQDKDGNPAADSPLGINETRVGQEQPFRMIYTQAEGDAVGTASMIVQTPSGVIVSVPAQRVAATDVTQGTDVVWNYRPQDSGKYRYHFEVTSATGSAARSPDFEFNSISLVTKLLICGVGLLISLLFLPFVSYVATRSVNKQGDPAAAARLSLLIGIVAFLALVVCVFAVPAFNYQWLGAALAAVIIIAVMVGLFSRRRMA